jgi:hypothetical protein
VGLLDSETRRFQEGGEAPIPADNWGVVRLKRNIGDRSTVGMIFTDRQKEDGSFNRVLGLDAELKPTDELGISGFWTESENSPTAGGRDWAGGVRADWQGTISSFGLDLMQIGSRYDPEVGFLLRQGIRRYLPRFTFQPRPQIAGVHNLIFDATCDIITGLDGQAQSIESSADLFGIHFTSDDEFRVFIDSSFERLTGPFEISPGVVIPVGGYHFQDGGVSFTTNNSRVWSASGFILAGQFYDGHRVSSELDLSFRPSAYLRTDTTWTRDDVRLRGGSFTANVVRQRIGVSLTPDLSTAAFVQYNQAIDLLSLNARFGWSYLPGSDLFLVFNQNWHLQSGRSSVAVQDRAVILKMTYLLQL